MFFLFVYRLNVIFFLYDYWFNFVLYFGKIFICEFYHTLTVWESLRMHAAVENYRTFEQAYLSSALQRARQHFILSFYNFVKTTY